MATASAAWLDKAVKTVDGRGSTSDNGALYGFTARSSGFVTMLGEHWQPFYTDLVEGCPCCLIHVAVAEHQKPYTLSQRNIN